MKRLTKFAWIFFAIFAGLSILGAARSLVNISAQDVRQQKGKKPDLPTLDYETEVTKAVGEDRKKRSARFSGRGNPDSTKRIAELPQGVVPLPANVHWWIGLSALPVAQSDVIVAGKVVDAQAHLSDDGTGIYSEFSVEVSDIFKDTTGSVSVGSTLPASRVGGSVRFASGKIQEYRIDRQGMPSKGSQYVLFLKREEGGDFTILTGYELSGGRVTPLDGEDNSDPRAALTFTSYKGAVESQFLQDLRIAIQGGNR